MEFAENINGFVERRVYNRRINDIGNPVAAPNQVDRRVSDRRATDRRVSERRVTDRRLPDSCAHYHIGNRADRIASVGLGKPITDEDVRRMIAPVLVRIAAGEFDSAFLFRQ